MQAQLRAVETFHERFGVSQKTPLPSSHDPYVKEVGEKLWEFADFLERFVNVDTRRLRAHLLLEELGEFLQAYADGDEVKALDGLTDLLYVLVGTAVSHDWPLAEAFEAVHESNMTKTRKSDDPGRVRDKGESFVPPDLARVLREHRALCTITCKASSKDGVVCADDECDRENGVRPVVRPDDHVFEDRG